MLFWDPLFFQASNGFTLGLRTTSVPTDRRIPIFEDQSVKVQSLKTAKSTSETTIGIVNNQHGILGINCVYMDITYNVETAILQGYPQSLLNKSSFRKQRIVAIKNPTSKYSSSAFCRLLAPALWRSWQGLQKNTSVVQIMKRGFKPRVLRFWESINRTNDPGGPPWVPEQFQSSQNFVLLPLPKIWV